MHRRGGYFVVIDRLTAHQDDTYNLTCRWRSFHAGRMVGPATFEAVDGLSQVRFRIRSAGPVTWQVETETRDGAARPTVVRQTQRRVLNRNTSATFQNLLYAANTAHPRDLAVRPLSDRAVLVEGTMDGREELAAIGVGTMDLVPAVATARLWYLSKTGLAADGVTALSVQGALRVRADAAVSLSLNVAAGKGWFENRTAAAIGVELETFGDTELTFNEQTNPSKLALNPGRHNFRVRGLADRFEVLHEVLLERWAGSARSDAVEAPGMEVRQGAVLNTLWEDKGVSPPRVEHGNVRIWAEPDTRIGTPETWRNRLVGPPSGYGWHGSERAGWTKGTPGAILMDLGAEIDIADVQLVRSRRYRTEAGTFNPGEFVFDVTLSNDNFQDDTRHVKAAPGEFGIYYLENAHYTHTRRFPMFTVPVNAQARFLRLVPRRVIDVKSPPANYYGTYKDGEISFMEIDVHRADREPRRTARLWYLPAHDSGIVLHQAGRHLRALSPEGHVVWRQELDAHPAALTQLADIDGDGATEVLVFSLAEKLSAYDAATGRRELVFDVNADPNTPDVTRVSHSRLRPNALAAWRPDRNGQLEVVFFPHYAYGRISPGPDRAFSAVSYPSTRRSGKFAFTVPDVTGDGREDLAVVGVYGNGFGVIASDAPLETGKLPGYVATAGITGYNSGNMELPLYWEGAVVSNRDGEWLGTVILNPGGIDFLAARTFKSQWSHFHHPPNRCFAQADLDDDGTPELLVGRKDGYVLAYAVADGGLVAKAALDGAVRCLGTSGDTIVAGTEQSLVLLDRELRPVARRPGAVEAVAVAPRADEPALIVAALSDGRVVGLHLR